MKKLFTSFKRTSWTDHFIQFFIVLLSITIAFNLESYRQKVNDREEELENMTSLLDELEEDIHFFQAEVDRNGIKLMSVKYFLEGQYKNIALKDDKYRDLTNITFLDERFAPNDITYTSMMNSGKLGSIKKKRAFLEDL